MTNTRFMVVILIVTLTLGCAHAVVLDEAKLKPLKERSLTLTLSVPKAQYLELEPIYLSYWMENSGSRTEHFRHAEIERFVVRDQEGTLYPYLGPEVQYLRMPFKGDTGNASSYADWIEVPARGCATKFVRNLLDYYGQGKRWLNLRLPAGVYTITGAGVRSDTLTITIVPPTMKEDVEAAEELERILNMQVHGDASRRFSAFGDFLSRFPTSPYAVVALRELIILDTFLPDPSQTQELALRFIVEYPQSGFVRDAIVEIDPTKLNQEQRRSLRDALRKVESAFPGGYWADEARKLAKKLGN